MSRRTLGSSEFGFGFTFGRDKKTMTYIPKSKVQDRRATSIGMSFGLQKSRVSSRDIGRRGSTFQEREEARKIAMRTFQPKKIKRYFDTKKDEEKKMQSIKEIRKQETLASKSSSNSLTSFEEGKKDRMKVAYNLGDVFSFQTCFEDLLKNCGKKFGFEIKEMQRNRITKDNDFVLVTILYEKGVEKLLPSVRKELLFSVMKNSCIFVEMRVDKRLRFDDLFQRKILQQSTLIVYWVDGLFENDDLEENVDILTSTKPESAEEQKYFWETVLFSPDLAPVDNELGIKKLKVKDSDSIRNSRQKYFINSGCEFRLFSKEALVKKFSNYFNRDEE